MTIKLFVQAMAKFLIGVLLVGALLFGAAGTFDFPQAWLFLGILFVPMFIAGLVMMAKNPELLRKRLYAKEKEGEQKTVLALCALMFITAFVLAGLNFRFRWLVFPMWVSWGAAVVFLLAYLMYAEVLRENVWLSRTVEVQENQKVVDTGVYGVVRHPMYCATLILFVSMGAVLGSPLSVAVLLCYIPIIALRIRNEEKVLEGYREYKQRVKHKVLPYIW